MAQDNSRSTPGDALGFVEVYGLSAAIETADAMAKAARVKIKSVCNADAGILSVVCEGDLAACQAATEAGKTAAARLGGMLRCNVIPRPYGDTVCLLTQHVGSMFKPKKPLVRKPRPKAK